MEGMKVGGQRLLVVPPELAYGPRGKPPLVPPNSTVEFAVSLLSVRRSGTNPNSVINMVCSAGRWRLRFGVLYCVSGAVQGGDGEEDVCATCERVPQEGVWGVGVGRLVRLGLSFSRTTTTHLACGVWLAWTVPLVRPVRDGLFSCAGCASVLSAAHGREARLLFRVGPMPALECLLFGVFFVFPSFYCLRAALACVTQFGVPSWQAATLPAPFGTYINRGHLCICVLLNTGCRQDAVGTNSAGTTHAREQHRTGNRGSQPQPIKTAMDW